MKRIGIRPWPGGKCILLGQGLGQAQYRAAIGRSRRRSVDAALLLARDRLHAALLPLGLAPQAGVGEGAGAQAPEAVEALVVIRDGATRHVAGLGEGRKGNENLR